MNNQDSLLKLKKEIEQKDYIKQAAGVLKFLESKGLEMCSIGAGFIRYFLTGDGDPNDIDVIYKGPVHFEDAQKYLSEALDKLKIDTEPWDINGIWNLQIRFPNFKTLEEEYPLAFFCTIEAVALKSDGLLHDFSGRGLSDSLTKTLHLINLCNKDLEYSNLRKCAYCLEGCRRIFKFGWKPTEETKDFLLNQVSFWDKLEDNQKSELIKKRIVNKFSVDQYEKAKKVYDMYGWGFIFNDLIK